MCFEKASFLGTISDRQSMPLQSGSLSPKFTVSGWFTQMAKQAYETISESLFYQLTPCRFTFWSGTGKIQKDFQRRRRKSKLFLVVV